MGSFSATHWLILAAIAFVLFKIFKPATGSGDQKYCKNCGHCGPSKNAVKGSIGIEIVLWLCMIFPGLIYSLWRLSSKTAACSKCGSLEVVPADSPVAIAALKNIENKP